MTSSENPPATKRHKGRHKREVLRKPQKCKGPRDNNLRHAGRQASGEGGIRTLGRVAPTPVFEPYPPGRADAAKHAVSAISHAHLNTRIRLSRTRPRPAASRAMPWVPAAAHGVAKSGPGRAPERLLRDAGRGVGGGRAAAMRCGRRRLINWLTAHAGMPLGVER